MHQSFHCCVGLIKSVGVSNYTREHLEELLQYCRIKPTVLQVMHILISYSYIRLSLVIVIVTTTRNSSGSLKSTEFVNIKILR